jgi:UDP-glucose 4-epimerase
MTILVTGGAGYIGSHTVVELLEAGRDVVVIDNFCASSPVSLDRVEQITGRRPILVEGDIRNRNLVESTIRRYAITSVIHFAGLKAVGDSNDDPLEYYNVNVVGSESLISAMKACDVFNLIFSSSATVYGEAEYLPFDENHPLRVTNPYGRTKLMIEDVLRDLGKSDERWRIGILRYFNPVGAHESGLIGEDPKGTPTNLVPIVVQVATGQRPELSVFGGNYDTADGTGVRDFIHVVDLAKGHVSALDALETRGSFAVNLGTGQGHSVLELVSTFERVTNRSIPYEIMDRRPGDIGTSVAGVQLSQELLGWRAERGLYEMARDVWNWVSKNPEGYGATFMPMQATLPGMETPQEPVQTPRGQSRRAVDFV